MNRHFLSAIISRANWWVILFTLAIGLVMSSVIPPLQSPDETDHVRRAYLLSRGDFLLKTPVGMASGGMIDTGLEAYVVANHPSQRLNGKYSADEVERFRTIRWTGVRKFSPSPGTGYYFPLVYLPQALGLATGQWLDLTVERSYFLARFACLVSVAILLSAAFSLWSTSPFAIALLLIPMSVFQFSSASLDGVSTALSIFAVATFQRLTSSRHRADPLLFCLLAISVGLLATSRVHLTPLLALLLVVCFQWKSRLVFLAFIATLALVVAWTLIAMLTTVDTRVVVGLPTSSVALFYLTNPLRFFEVVGATLSGDRPTIYRDTFIGLLGWLAVRFTPKAYDFLFVCLALAGLLSISYKKPAAGWMPQIVLVLSALSSVFIIFFALLVTWNPHPASVIEGVQGRYFLVPVIMVAYATSGDLELTHGWPRKGALVLVGLIGAFTLFSMPRVLIEWYYLGLAQPSHSAGALRPSTPLDAMNPITLFMRPDAPDHSEPLDRIGILFGTYARSNSGSAELVLESSDGRTLTVPFDLARLADNSYHFFTLDSKPYSSGSVVSGTGGGVSLWESHGVGGVIATCLIREYANGRTTTTPGCPGQ